jgi:hemoglobin-like flavoprotein
MQLKQVDEMYIKMIQENPQLKEMYEKQRKQTREEIIKARDNALKEYDKSTINTEKEIREDWKNSPI